MRVDFTTPFNNMMRSAAMASTVFGIKKAIDERSQKEPEDVYYDDDEVKDMPEATKEDV